MLNILKHAYISEDDGVVSLLYFGEKTGYHYILTQDDGAFDLYVEDLDKNGDVFTKYFFGCSSLSAAIAQIEEMENGEEV
jgi:hypothetical protein